MTPSSTFKLSGTLILVTAFSVGPAAADDCARLRNKAAEGKALTLDELVTFRKCSAKVVIGTGGTSGFGVEGAAYIVNIMDRLKFSSGGIAE